MSCKNRYFLVGFKMGNANWSPILDMKSAKMSTKCFGKFEIREYLQKQRKLSANHCHCPNGGTGEQAWKGTWTPLFTELNKVHQWANARFPGKRRFQRPTGASDTGRYVNKNSTFQSYLQGRVKISQIRNKNIIFQSALGWDSFAIWYYLKIHSKIRLAL